MYTQQEKDGMAMKNATIDKFSKKDPCPKGMVDDGKGGCVSIINKLKAVTFGEKADAFGEAAKDKLKSQQRAEMEDKRKRMNKNKSQELESYLMQQAESKKKNN